MVMKVKIIVTITTTIGLGILPAIFPSFSPRRMRALNHESNCVSYLYLANDIFKLFIVHGGRAISELDDISHATSCVHGWAVVLDCQHLLWEY